MTSREYNQKYYAERPWRRCHDNIKKRCKAGDRYYDKGIRNYLTLEDVAFLWAKDRAYRMKRPSIDRIDNDGHYTLDNCRFIELSENSRRNKIGKKRGPMSEEQKRKISGSLLDYHIAKYCEDK